VFDALAQKQHDSEGKEQRGDNRVCEAGLAASCRSHDELVKYVYDPKNDQRGAGKFVDVHTLLRFKISL